MNVIIIGAGASGITAAINYKRNHQKDNVLVIEHLDKPLKKILVTGNGKCNLGNSNINYELYKNSTFAKKVINGYDYKQFFESISIKTKLVDSLAYPVSESAVSVREAMLKEASKLKIEIKLSENLVDYSVDKIIKVKTDKSTYECDKLFIAGGLKSSPKQGSDGSAFEILVKHGYKFNIPDPGLTPIFTKEKTRLLDGVRVKANVTLLKNNKVIHEEKGEVLFKEHGLSGIVIFNTASIIARDQNAKYKISLDILPDYDEKNLKEYLSNHNVDEFLLAYVNPKIASFLREEIKAKDIVKITKNLEFTYDKSYGFDFSQVSVGGILETEVDEKLMSKREKNVFIIGELLDNDGPCGGYNLTWAFATAFKSTK